VKKLGLSLIVCSLITTGLVGCTTTSTTTQTIIPTNTQITISSSSDAYQPDASKIVQLPMADLQGGTTISVPAFDSRIIPFVVDTGEQLVAYAILTAGDLGFSYSLQSSEGQVIKQDTGGKQNNATQYDYEGIGVSAGKYYLNLNNTAKEMQTEIMYVRLIFKNINAPQDEVANLPITGEVTLPANINSPLTILFYEPKFGSSTYQNIHVSNAFSLQKGQTIHLKIESDTNVNYNSPAFSAQNGILVGFYYLSSYDEYQWFIIGTERPNQMLTSNGGKTMDAVFTISNTFDNPYSYKIKIINYDSTVSHTVKYTISLEP